MTISWPPGNSVLFKRKDSLMSRLNRFLWTAFPILLLTAIPSLVTPHPFFIKEIVKCSLRSFLPNRFRLTKSFRSNNLSDFKKVYEYMKRLRADYEEGGR